MQAADRRIAPYDVPNSDGGGFRGTRDRLPLQPATLLVHCSAGNVADGNGFFWGGRFGNLAMAAADET